MSVERWLPVVGFEGWYSVSDQGRVRSEDRVITRSDGVVVTWRSRMMSSKPDLNGYPILTLQQQGRIRKVRVHALVAEAFIGLRPEGLEVLHRDGNPANNHLSNIRYGTHAENGRDTQQYRTHCGNGHEFTLENTYRRKDTDSRMCLACQRARRRAYYQESKR